MEKNVSIETNYNSIDLVKFIMAFAVVAIHTHPLEFCRNKIILSVYTNIVEIAVPFFFLASGFFLEKKAKGTWDSNTIYSQVIKISKMYLMWMAIYTPLSIYHSISLHETMKRWCLGFIRGMIFVGEQYNSWPLWYLLSTIYALLLIMVLIKRGMTHKGLLAISVVFAILSIGIDTFLDVTKEMSDLSLLSKCVKYLLKYSVSNGRIFSGAIFIPIGMYLAQNKLSIPINTALFAVCFAVRCTVDNIAIKAVLLIGVSIGFFGLVETISLKERPIYPKLRKASTVVYLVHMYVWTFYYFFAYGEKTYGIDSFIITSVSSCVVALVYSYVRPKGIKA